MSLLHLWRLPIRHHFFGSLAITAVIALALGYQIAHRTTFANSELYEDVVDRWGAPIRQAAPSVRYAPSGSVLRRLLPMTPTAQNVVVDATMRYRKRGLAYFSGFDFVFDGDYQLTNPTDGPIDVVFVFPFHAERTRTLLSDLAFRVNGELARGLHEDDEKIVWTGRLDVGESVDVAIDFRGRGLDFFQYELDPALGVAALDFTLNVTGGTNYDYPFGVVPATHHQTRDDGLTLRWKYDSTASGFGVGLVLPSERSYDPLIATMLRRSLVVFLAYFVGLVALVAHFGRERLTLLQAYVLAAVYALFFVLLAYGGAFFGFWAGFVLAAGIAGALVPYYLGRILGARAIPAAFVLVVATLWLPSLAVALQGFTGVIYTAEALLALGGIAFVTSDRAFDMTLRRIAEV